MDKPQARRIQTDAEFDAQIDAWREKYGDQPDDNEPLAKTVRYDQRLKLLLVGLTNGRRLVLPIENLQGLKNATAKQLQKVEIENLGTAISFPDLDADYYVPSLIEGVYGNRRWMSEMGKRGGSAKTEAKQEAARANGAKGGRPRKVVADTRALDGRGRTKSGVIGQHGKKAAKRANG
jgi:hypothetical protein